MILENQVCSLEQAKKLSSFGLNKLKAYLSWYVPYYKKNKEVYRAEVALINPHDLRVFDCEEFPAFSCAELALFLPEELYGRECNYRLHQFQYCEKGFINDFGLFYQSVKDEKARIPDKILFAKHEAHVRAEMLIYLLENNIVGAEYMNRRCQFIK